ncbi:MAG: cell division protein ZapE [Alphaproteobacteria bacterium]|nr:cell division protein ZapE [Alphaproteobacteria bacterium]
MKTGPLWDAYETGCLRRAFHENSHQQGVLYYLHNLYQALETTRAFSFMSKQPVAKGLYIWGEPGRGKTFLMDLFYKHIQKTPKIRIHFDEFMRGIHQTLHGMNVKNEGALPELIKKTSKKAKLFCFDEFQVTNIADAMVMRRLFEGLFQEGVIMVATSNISPENLYDKGLHRERFVPFISLLEKHLDVYHLQGEIDYRCLKLATQKRYFTPCNEETKRHLLTIWGELTDGAPMLDVILEREGPLLPLKGLAKGVAWANFHDLCGKAYGRNEYLDLAHHIHTLILWGIPKMVAEDHNEAHRFTTLIDILYDKKVWLIAAADTAPEYLYSQGGTFDRTVSRLYEMQHG